MNAKIFSVREKTTVKYTATIKDENGTAIPAASLSSLTLTLYNMGSTARDIINSRDAQNVLNVNNVTIDSNGIITWSMQPNDNAIIDANKKTERHRALFVFTWDAGAKKGTHLVDFDVENLEKIS